jgi:two-component system, cell cycle response regulator
MTLLTARQVIVRIALIIASAELLIALLLRLIPLEIGAPAEVLLDAALLAGVSIPAIYFWVIKPFVAARDEAFAHINYLAFTDPLTQLANRRLILIHLEKAIAASIRHRDHGAVLLIDLDGFKRVNDSRGHEAGDATLVEIADRLRAVLRSEDVIGRLGGDEFVALIHRLGADEGMARDRAKQIAAKLIDTLRQPFDFNGTTLQVGASIGIRLLGFEKLDTETAIGQADAAMYRAKEAGKGCAVFFEQ